MAVVRLDPDFVWYPQALVASLAVVVLGVPMYPVFVAADGSALLTGISIVLFLCGFFALAYGRALSVKVRKRRIGPRELVLSGAGIAFKHGDGELLAEAEWHQVTATRLVVSFPIRRGAMTRNDYGRYPVLRLGIGPETVHIGHQDMAAEWSPELPVSGRHVVFGYTTSPAHWTTLIRKLDAKKVAWA